MRVLKLVGLIFKVAVTTGGVVLMEKMGMDGFVAQRVTLNQSMLAVNRSYRSSMIDVYKIL